jgi:hypothetical protein
MRCWTIADVRASALSAHQLNHRRGGAQLILPGSDVAVKDTQLVANAIAARLETDLDIAQLHIRDIESVNHLLHAPHLVQGILHIVLKAAVIPHGHRAKDVSARLKHRDHLACLAMYGDESRAVRKRGVDQLLTQRIGDAGGLAVSTQHGKLAHTVQAVQVDVHSFVAALYAASVVRVLGSTVVAVLRLKSRLPADDDASTRQQPHSDLACVQLVRPTRPDVPCHGAKVRSVNLSHAARRQRNRGQLGRFG